MSDKWKNLKYGVKISDKYQLIRKTLPGGGGPTFTGITIADKKPVHIRFYSPADIQNQTDLENCVQKAREAAEILPQNVAVPIDFNVYEGIPFSIYKISNVKTFYEFVTKREKLRGNEIEAILSFTIEIFTILHSKKIPYLCLSPLQLHHEEGGFHKSPPCLLDAGFAPSKGGSFFIRAAEDDPTLTPIAAFAAPEQAAGESKLDITADIYSIGAFAYWLITGKVPFEGKTTSEIFQNITSKEPEYLNDESNILFPEIKSFLKKALAKDPEKRFKNTDEMISAIEKINLGKIEEVQINKFSSPVKEKKGITGQSIPGKKLDSIKISPNEQTIETKVPAPSKEITFPKIEVTEKTPTKIPEIQNSSGEIQKTHDLQNVDTNRLEQVKDQQEKTSVSKPEDKKDEMQPAVEISITEEISLSEIEEIKEKAPEKEKEPVKEPQLPEIKEEHKLEKDVKRKKMVIYISGSIVFFILIIAIISGVFISSKKGVKEIKRKENSEISPQQKISTIHETSKKIQQPGQTQYSEKQEVKPPIQKVEEIEKENARQMEKSMENEKGKKIEPEKQQKAVPAKKQSKKETETTEKDKSAKEQKKEKEIKKKPKLEFVD